MNNFDVIIIGGGAAGLTAALSASRGAKRVAVLEAAPRVGRKILASGNGRCNLCNMGAPRYYGGRAFAEKVLARKSATDVLSFFRGIGLYALEETGGRVYPVTGQAASVLDALRGAAERAGVTVLCDAPVTSLRKTGNGFSLTADGTEYRARAVVAAFGGMAGGKLGHDGQPYRLLTALGHDLREPQPALTQLITEKAAVKGLSGLRMPARLTLAVDGAPQAAAAGEVLFADYGISGVCAMQLSRDAGELCRRGQRPVLYLDFSPAMGLTPRVYDRVAPEPVGCNTEKVLVCLRERAHILPKEALLTGLLPRLLAEKVKGLPLPEMARMLAAYPAEVTGVRGFENAQVTAGGIACREFDEATLASRLVPGLYAAGELMDVDGDCGGYNLLFAFASGLIAGENAAKGRGEE